MPAGVASVDGVTESRGARVEKECDSSDPLLHVVVLYVITVRN